MKTLYKQYILVTLFIIIASISISIILLDGLYNIVIREDTNNEMIDIGEQVVDGIVNLPEDQIDTYLQSIASFGYQIAWLNEKQQLHFYGQAFDETQITNEMISTVNANEVFDGIKNYSHRLSIINHYANDVQNTVGIPIQLNEKLHAIFIRAETTQSFDEMHYLIVGFLIVSALLIFIAMLLLARQLVQPIKKLQLATEQITKEDYNINLEIDRNDELGKLATQFQKMADQLARNDQIKKDFINNVSHDFQSPLLNIQGYSAVLKDGDITEQERVQYLTIIEQETKRLSVLTKQLLLLSSLDQRELPINQKQFSLNEQLKKLIIAKRWMLEEHEMQLNYELNDCEIIADPHLLEQVWDNLLTNAIRYNKNKGKIIITCKTEKQKIIVTFKDYGIGIPESILPRITERFFRVDPSRNTQSSGLGLAIVNEIVYRHNGRLFIESTLGKGTMVTVELPNNS